jgi:hypothetical protein
MKDIARRRHQVLQPATLFGSPSILMTVPRMVPNSASAQP